MQFWMLLASATAILSSIAVMVSRKRLNLRVSATLVLYGIGVAVLMYALFFVGFEATKSYPIFSQGVNRVYALSYDEPSWVIGLLLIFPIGPGEELYWRGMIQRIFSEKGGPYVGIGCASLAYALVHIPTLNGPLILTALIGGLIWGTLYELTGSLTPGIVSHVLWDLMIFLFLPLR